MTYQIFKLPKEVLVSGGTVQAGWKVNFFVTGTSTPANVYTTSALSVTHSQPVVADSAGVLATVYLDPSIVYKASVYDQNDVLQYTVDPVNDSLLSQAAIGALLYPRTAAEIAAGVTPTNYALPPGYALRFGTNSTPGTTDMTSAIQAALDSNEVVWLPNEMLAFTNLTIPGRRTIIGTGPRSSVLRQITGTTGSAFTFDDLATTDITDGAFRFDNFAVHVATTSHGIDINGVNASMLMTDNFRLVSRQAESLGSPPYATTSNQRGIYIRNGSSGSVFMSNHRNLEIRSFDIAIDADDVINEWHVHGWILDCRIAVRLSDCSTWDLSGVTVESGVQNARALQTFNAVSNVVWYGGRWELTQTGCYGVEGDGTTTGQNWRFGGINVAISSDGTGIPGRKWTGTVPNDFVFEGYDIIDGSVTPFVIIPNLVKIRLPNLIKMGGASLGNAKITLGRNADNGAPCSIEHDGTHLKISAGNSSTFFTGGTLAAATLDDTTTAGNTRLLVYDVDNGQLERVTVGAADSGGVGYKVLRIPN